MKPKRPNGEDMLRDCEKNPEPDDCRVGGICGDEETESDCHHCHDTGRIPAMDGCSEYLGYDYVPCPHCQRGLSR